MKYNCLEFCDISWGCFNVHDKHDAAIDGIRCEFNEFQKFYVKTFASTATQF